LVELSKRIADFYLEGFRSMRLGKKLWAIALIKLFILFVVIKTLFFPDIMKENFRNDAERGAYVLDRLTETASEKP